MEAAVATFTDWVDREQAARAERANLRAREVETGVPEDDTGRYWLQRVAALEVVASAAEKVAKSEPGLCGDLRAALDDLERVKAPVCREGDHA